MYSKSIKLICLVTIFFGLCFFTQIAFNPNPTAAQNKTAANTEDPPKFALLVGVSKFQSKNIPPIEGCENNVAELKKTLVGKYSFDEKNIVTLINEKATKAEIPAKFRSHLIDNARKAKSQGKEAVIVYYFCGHGSQYADQPENKDENDNKDETFVAYDSRTKDVYDILDDELDDLKFELRPFTSNATLILESCHSGTGSRGDEQFTSQQIDEDTRKRPAYQRNPLNRVNESEEISNTYTEIAASVSFKSAKSETKDFCQCDKPMSLMTKALIEGLNRATHTTTYRNLVKEMSVQVAKFSDQEPQVEGNSNAILFQGKAKRTNSYIEISEILPNQEIKIKAGSIHGLKEGSQISLYSSESLTNIGKENWLMNGTVKKVGLAESVVVLKPENAEKLKQVNQYSHAVLTSPVFGGGGLLLALNPTNSKSLAPTETNLHKEIEESLTTKKLLEKGTIKMIPSDRISPNDLSNSLGIVRLRRGILKVQKQAGTVSSLTIEPLAGYASPAKTKKVLPIKLNMIGSAKPEMYCDGEIPKTRTDEERLPKDNSEVYYLDDGEAGGIPLFGKYFAVDDPNLSEKLADMVTNLTYRNMLLSLDNKSPDSLASKVAVNLQVIKNFERVPTCRNGVFYNVTKDKNFMSKFVNSKDKNLLPGTAFRFNVTNNSKEVNKKINEFAGGDEFYVAIILLSNDGGIKIAYQSEKNDKLLDKAGKDTTTFIATNPIGVEHLIVIVSKFHADFKFYERRGVPRSPESILETVLTQSGTTTRDSETVSDAPDQWGVVQLDLNIMDK